MKGTCTEKTCKVSALLACQMGEADHTRCEHFQAASDATGESGTGDADDSSPSDFRLLPWTGNSLGSQTLEFVAARDRQFLVGLIGNFNAGKTTFLSLLYLWFSRGVGQWPERFAGSYTIEGWENLARPLRWDENALTPTFPEHTPSGQERTPGLLHLLARDERDLIQSLLFTDPPGEWFSHWVGDRNHALAKGARWIQEHADLFLVFADSEALQEGSASLGETRNLIKSFADRIYDDLGGRAVALVWSKSDKVVHPTTREAIQEYYQTRFPDLKEFHIQIPSPTFPEAEAASNVRNLFDWVMSMQKGYGGRNEITLPVMVPEDPLLAFRGEAV